MARKQELTILGLIFVAILILIGISLYYWDSRNTVAKKNALLEQQDNELRTINNHLASQNEELRVKDSIHVSLRNRIDNDEQIIRMTTQELQDVLTQLRLANQKLEKSKSDLEVERDKLKEDKRDLTQQLSKQVTIAREAEVAKAAVTALEQSQKLSQRAQAILNVRAEPTERQYKEAFQLARHAWELSPRNSQAMDVLNAINNEKMRSSNNGGFLSNDRPRITYTRSKIQRMIEDIDRKYQYGRLSDAEIKRLLRR